MDKHIKRIIDYIFDFTTKSEYAFREVCGFTFVFRRDITTLNNELTSAEIIPIGIIYEENDEYYFAPLDGQYEIDEIVKSFAEKCI